MPAAARTLGRPALLFANVLLIATCGLLYELLAGTLASYVLGDSVTQFSLIIGLYLSAMGVGAWLSGKITTGLARTFVEVELGVALLGGLSAPLLFLAFARLSWFRLALYGEVFAIGVLVGLEIPLLMRILKDELDFKDLVSRIFTFDYLGALIASLCFPLVLVPTLGLVRTSLCAGIINAGVGLWATSLLAPLIDPRRLIGLRVRGGICLAILGVALVQADRLTTIAEDDLFVDEIVHARTTPYQRIVVTRGPAGFQLFLNGHLQFSSADEYRYHEALVHPPIVAADAPVRRVLVLGGGDGLAVREVLRHPGVERVTLVDLDAGVTELARSFPPLVALTANSLADPRVEIVHADAMIWLEDDPATHGGAYDAAIVDFPDPNSYALGKLYTVRFYRLLARHLAPGGAASVQATSPLFARTSYWTIARTMEAAGLSVHPYHATVPSFGVWGFMLARRTPFAPPTVAPPGLRYLNDAALAALFALPADLGPVPVEPNRLDNQVLVRAYEQEWRRWED